MFEYVPDWKHNTGRQRLKLESISKKGGLASFVNWTSIINSEGGISPTFSNMLMPELATSSAALDTEWLRELLGRSTVRSPLWS